MLRVLLVGGCGVSPALASQLRLPLVGAVGISRARHWPLAYPAEAGTRSIRRQFGLRALRGAAGVEPAPPEQGGLCRPSSALTPELRTAQRHIARPAAFATGAATCDLEPGCVCMSRPGWLRDGTRSPPARGRRGSCDCAISRPVRHRRRAFTACLSSGQPWPSCHYQAASSSTTSLATAARMLPRVRGTHQHPRRAVRIPRTDRASSSPRLLFTLQAPVASVAWCRQASSPAEARDPIRT